MQILKDEIREQIINAAIEIFLRKGYEKASMQSIASVANISVSNIYNYYDNKEKLFDAVIEPFFRQINHLLRYFIEQETGNSFRNADFVEEFIQNVAQGIGKLIQKNHLQLVIIFDKSQGTRYEHFKEELIEFLEDHFNNGLEEQRLSESISFIIHISATNLVEGLLEIARHYRDDIWVEMAVNDFIRYHIYGLAQFYD